MTLNAKHRGKHAESLLKLFKDQYLCDVKCIVGEEKKEIGAHSALLAAISPVFKRMLRENEQHGNHQARILEITDIHPASFKCVLEFAYFNNPTLTMNIVPSVRNICDKYEIQLLSEVCDDYSEAYWPNFIKTTRQKIIKKYKANKRVKAQWKEILKTKNFGRYKKSAIGSLAVHHILDSSDDIRNEMGNIIPQCDLKFTSDADMSNYRLFYKTRLSDAFEHPSQMEQLIDNRLYNSHICFEFNGILNAFWCKSFGRSALEKAMNASVSDYIVRYGPQRVLYFLNDMFRVKLSGQNIGVAFCNLYHTKKKIKGHQMIQFDEDSMVNDEIEFFVRNNVVLDQIKMTLVAKGKKKNQLVLFEWQEAEFKSNISNEFPQNQNQQAAFPQNQNQPPQPFAHNHQIQCHAPPLNNGYGVSRGPTHSVIPDRNYPLGGKVHGIANNDPTSTIPNAYNFHGNHINENDTMCMDPSSMFDNVSVNLFPPNPFNQSTTIFGDPAFN